jgi:energy-coupling factor transporter transmembrane protein EcfT
MAAHEGQQTAFDWGIVFSIVACLFLGAALFLFIDNNDLFANGAEKLRHPEAFVMLGVLGIPFVLMLLHVIRALLPAQRSRSVPPSSE